MADCYYHGQSPSGPCPDCARERENDEEHGSSESTYQDWTQKDFEDTEDRRYRKEK